jgi:hypothetical protein
MKKSHQLGAFCVCVFSLLFGNISHAALVQYDYTGNTFNANNGTNPLCAIGAPGCFNNITATIELSAALGSNQSLQAITPDAWSISDGLTTITDQTAEFDLFTLEVGTDGFGNISKWNISVNRNNTQPLDELSFMRTIYDAGLSAVDDTRYCTEFTDSACSYIAVTLLNDDHGTWAITTVPLPASVWLLGSGLMGLIGMSMRNKA